MTRITSIMLFVLAGLTVPYSSRAEPLDDWYLRTSPTTNSLYAAAYGNNIFVAVGYGTILTSHNGADWIDASSGYESWWFRGVAYGNGIFVAVGPEGSIVTSLDGLTWTDQSLGYGSFRAVTYGQGKFVAVGLGHTIVTSLDGITWTARDSGTSKELLAVTYGDILSPTAYPTFVAVGQDGTILSSPTGEQWQPRSSGTFATLNGVIYTQGCGAGGYYSPKFVAVGQGGTILNSGDGIIWGPTTSGTSDYLYGVTVYIHTYVAVGDTGTILTSSDGAAWTPRTSGSYELLFGATYGNVYVAVGSNGTILQSDPLSQSFDFDCDDEGWRALGLFDDLGFDPIPGWFVDLPAPWSDAEGNPYPGVIGLGTFAPVQYPPSPTGDPILHADLWSCELSYYDQWQNMSSFSFNVTGNAIATDLPIWVAAVLWGIQPDGSIGFFSDGVFYWIPTWPDGNWETHTVDVTSLGIPAGTVISFVELLFVFLPESWVYGFVLVDHVVTFPVEGAEQPLGVGQIMSIDRSSFALSEVELRMRIGERRPDLINFLAEQQTRTLPARTR